MADSFFIPLRSDVGIQRDGTSFDSSMHTDGSWSRFYHGRPQKIGGMQLIANGSTELVRNMYVYDSDGFSFYYLGRASSLSLIQIFSDLLTSGESNVTPSSGFVPNQNNNWFFSSVTVNNVTYILASCVPDLLNIGYSVAQPIFYGILGSSTPLIPIPGIDTSGVVFGLNGYVIVAGENGNVIWTDGASVDNFPANNFAALRTSKYVYAAQVRSSSQPVALLWSLGGLDQLTFQPLAPGQTSSEGSNAFVLSTVSNRSTLMSLNCLVSFDPVFYWVGNDSFWMWNGAVQELQNEVNKTWFFENINPNEKGKTFAFTITKWNEIWICFCKGTATEPNWAIVHNIQTGSWYDTNQIPRSSGMPSGSVVTYPILGSNKLVNGTYPLYAHEIGTDLVEQQTITPIVSSITSRYYNLWADNPNAKVMEVDSVIIDIKQVGNMYFYLSYQGYPNSVPQITPNFDFTTETQFLTVRLKASLFTITFVSNVLGGDFVMGNTMLSMNTTDDQRPGPST